MGTNTTVRTLQFSLALAATAFAALLMLSYVPIGNAQHTALEPRTIAPQNYTPQPRSAASDEGERLYAQLKCADCHRIGGKGGVAGPPLDGIGARREEWFLIGQVADPQAFSNEFPELKAWEPSYMRHELVSAKDVTAIVAYLMTLPEPEGGYAVGRHDPGQAPALDAQPKDWTPVRDSELSAQGRKIYFDSGCASCHSIGRYGGMFGPRLDGIGGRHSRAYITAYISSPQLTARHRREGGSLPTVMPPMDLRPAEVAAVTEFLLTLADRGTP